MTIRHFILIVRVLTAASFIAVGVLHFIRPAPFVRIIPPYIPAPEFMVYLSGVFEILGGVGLLIAPFRKVAGWGLIALTIVVFQANIYMAVEKVYLDGMPKEPWLLYARLPFQVLFLVMIWLSMKDTTKRG
jgi:uncharacterized membrane protein